ncbi:MAG: mechanosensitive ion channel [Oligoflexales bacterium]|nr:mechanosensitive ion channel [Oligoflexales bacterium]
MDLEDLGISFDLHSSFLEKFLSTLILLSLLTICRSLILKSIEKWRFQDLDDLQRWRVQIRNLWLLLISVGIILIWATELKTFAISLVAIAASITLAAKELIQCFLGGLMRSGTHLFGIGDRIAIGSYRGDVIDHTLLNTTVLEVGPEKNVHLYTGKTICIPNALFLTTPITNETNRDKYTLHTFSLAFSRGSDWSKIESNLLTVCQKECGPYLEKASKSIDFYAMRQRGNPSSDIEPKIFIDLHDAECLTFTVRVPVPAKKKALVEQNIIREFLKTTVD